MFEKTSITVRLVGGLMLIVLFFLIQSILVWYAIDNAKNNVVQTTHKNTLATTELSKLAVLAQQIRRYEKEYFVYVGNTDKRGSYEREWRDAMSKIEATLANMKANKEKAFSANDVEQVDNWIDASDYYSAEMKKIFAVVDERAARIATARDASAAPPPAPPASGKGKDAHAAAPAIVIPAAYQPVDVNDMIKPGKDRFSAVLIKGVDTMDKAKSAATLSLSKVAEQMFDNVLHGMLFTVVLGVLVALVLSRKLPSTVKRTIDRLTRAAHEMSMGNLQQAYDAGGVVEFERLAEALNRMRLAQQALVERLQKRH